MARPLSLEPDQARWFRARRTGLAQPLADAAAAKVQAPSTSGGPRRS